MEEGSKNAGQGELKPGLSFSRFLAGIAQFVNKYGLVSSLTPSLGKIRANRP
jgi:hypothetical protein